MNRAANRVVKFSRKSAAVWVYAARSSSMQLRPSFRNTPSSRPWDRDALRELFPRGRRCVRVDCRPRSGAFADSPAVGQVSPGRCRPPDVPRDGRVADRRDQRAWRARAAIAEHVHRRHAWPWRGSCPLRCGASTSARGRCDEIESAGRILTLRGRYMGIVGLGSIGTEVARLASAARHACRGRRAVARTSRAARRRARAAAGAPPRAAGRSDVVVLATALTPDTGSSSAAPRSSEVKRGAFLVNIGRGRLIDDEAVLVDAARRPARRRRARCLYDGAAPTGQSLVGPAERHRHAAHVRRHGGLLDAARRPVRREPAPVRPGRTARQRRRQSRRVLNAFDAESQSQSSNRQIVKSPCLPCHDPAVRFFVALLARCDVAAVQSSGRFRRVAGSQQHLCRCSATPSFARTRTTARRSRRDCSTSTASSTKAPGLNGRSSIRKVKIETGEVLQKRDVPAQYFGEGIAVWKNELFQLTWQSDVAFVYDGRTFAPKRSHRYPGEGWGLTTDATGWS